MVFGSIREHASTAIFLRARDKKFAFRAASTSYIFPLQQSIEILFFKILQKIV